jgi:hypothetical protein
MAQAREAFVYAENVVDTIDVDFNVPGVSTSCYPSDSHCSCRSASLC